MEDIRVGRLIRLVRRRRRLRQSEVASKAGVSQQTVSRVERGLFEEAGLRAVRAVAQVLQISLPFEPRYSAGAADRVLDARHLAVVQRLVPQFEALGWTVRLEYSFNHYGERGCVDILGWQPRQMALAIVEVKSELHDVQALLRSIDVRDRVLRGLVRREFGEQPRHVASILALADDSTNRRAVDRYTTALDVGLPLRTVALKRWMRNSSGDVRGISFVRASPARRANHNAGGSGRVRKGPDW